SGVLPLPTLAVNPPRQTSSARASNTDRWVPVEPSAKLAGHPLSPVRLFPSIEESTTGAGKARKVAPLSPGELLPLVPPKQAQPEPSQPTASSRVPTLAPPAEAKRPTLAPIQVAQRPDKPTTTELKPASKPQPAETRPDTIWQPPKQLFAQLAELSQSPETADWSTRAQKTVRALGQVFDDQPDRANTVCDQLTSLVAQAEPLAARLGADASATQLRRAAYALQRRLHVWRQMVDPRQQEPNPIPTALQGDARLRWALAKINDMTAGSPQGESWRKYLLLDKLEDLVASSEPNVDARRQLARRILLRVAQAPMDDTQQQFLKSEPLAALGWELRRMATGPLDRAVLLERLERYEETGLASDGRRLGDLCLWLGVTPGGTNKAVHDQLATHYRNANVRIALAEDFLNRLIPDRLPELAPVHDVILGNPVHGERLTESKVSVRLIPDPTRLRLALEVTGEVAALTSSTSGPATFRNASQSTYVASKPLEITANGLKLWPAEVEKVDNVTRLRSLKTDFDAIPLIGSFVKSIARDQHEKKHPELRREIRRKVADRAKQQIDEEADARLKEASERLTQKVFRPLDRLALGPALIEASTTDERLTMRVRLASQQQLGAHTPRPRAPSDSLASVQVHQTALNNFIERLGLDGQTFSVPELNERIAQRLGRPLPAADDEDAESEEDVAEDEDVLITFAPKDAIHVECQDGRLALTVAITELSTRTQCWEDFRVRVFYRPKVDGLSARLVRDGVIELYGPYLRTGEKVILRSVMTRVFLKNRARQIMPKRLREEPKLADVVLTQLSIDDGWIAIALGPKDRVAAKQKPVR
ncbi:MAG: hypothetical protein JW818_05010, partial [Pirellulales bacterium]|nr:hypothetical protein [Pirellulales bacterium]